MIFIILIAAYEETDIQPQSPKLLSSVDDDQLPTSIEDRVDPFTLRYHERDPNNIPSHNSFYQGHSSNGIRPYDLKYDFRHLEGVAQPPISGQSSTIVEVINQPRTDTDTLDINSQVAGSHLRSSSGASIYSMPSTIRTNSAPTVRQIQLQTEANDLRQQVMVLHNALDRSNEGMHAAMNRMMLHIQSLEGQVNSDWARGLSEEAPPGYESV
ncbi:hypothetical protein VKT23_004974 [Stygiomarasmius scandens]|uniref:Uncharacterized protein n=1 Tax=Marasmiellus scandens TaxID=2682957 RepID=A0ABR1JXL7_9AGAR